MLKTCKLLCSLLLTTVVVGEGLRVTDVVGCYVGDWFRYVEVWRYELPARTEDMEVTVQFKLWDETGTEIVSGVSIPFTLSKDVNVLYSTDIPGWEELTYSEAERNRILRTNRLREGRYQLWVAIFSYMEMLTQDTVWITVVEPNPPELIEPLDNDTLYTQYPVFEWTPVELPADVTVIYRVRVWELLEGQTIAEATRNVPWWQVELENTTRIVYPVEARPLEFNKSYIWQVQTFDVAGYPLGDNEGKSEVYQFTVVPHAATVLPVTIGTEMAVNKELIECELLDHYMFIPAWICESIGGNIYTGMIDTAMVLPEIDTTSNMFAIWIDSLAIDSIDGVIHISIKPIVVTDTIVMATFMYRYVGDTLWHVIEIDTTCDDGYRCMWEVDASRYGTYEVEVGALDNHYRWAECFAFIHAGKVQAEEILYEWGDYEKLERKADSLREELNKVSGKIDELKSRLRRLQQEEKRIQPERRRIWQEYKREESAVDALRGIDRHIIPKLSNLYKDSVIKILNRLKQLPVPDTANIDRIYTEAKWRMESCADNLQKLQQKRKGLQQRKQQLEQLIRAEQTKIMGRYVGKLKIVGFYNYGPAIMLTTEGKVLVGWVFSDITRRYNELISEYEKVKKEIEKLDRLIPDKQSELNKLRDAFNKAKKAKQQRDERKALMVKLTEYCRQIRQLVSVLVKLCRSHPTACSEFQHLVDRIRQQVEKCDSIEVEWDEFWRTLNTLHTWKREKEQDLKQHVERLEDEVRQLVERLDEIFLEKERIRDSLQTLLPVRDSINKDLSQLELYLQKRKCVHELYKAIRARLEQLKTIYEDEEAERELREELEKVGIKNAFESALRELPDSLKRKADGELITWSDFVSAMISGAPDLIKGTFIKPATVKVGLAGMGATAFLNILYSMYINWMQSAIIEGWIRIVCKELCNMIQLEQKDCGYIRNDEHPPSVIYYRKYGKGAIVIVLGPTSYACKCEFSE